MNAQITYLKKLLTIKYLLCGLFLISLFFLNEFHALSQNNPNVTTTSKDTLKQNNNQSIQEYLKHQSSNSFIYKKLYEWLVVSQDSAVSKNDVLTAFEVENKKYNNKVIRSVLIKQVSPFAKNILDTLNFTTNKLEKYLSSLRFETKKSIIKNNLTFKKGEFVKAYKLNDSERILRSLSFIRDALIVVEPAIADTSLVNVLVFTQDSYPYGANINSIGRNIEVGFYSKNVLGYGLEVEHSFSNQSPGKQKIGIREKLSWNNIYGSNISLSAAISRMNTSNYYTIGAQKDFHIPEIKYAGGFNLTRNYKITKDSDKPTFVWENNHHYLEQDYWLGRSYLINAENFFDRSNITLMGQALLTDYYQIVDSLSEIPRYLPNVNIFGSISFSKRDYYKNKLIYNYGRTEDVPYGFLGSISFGYNQNKLKLRYYAGAHFSFGKALIPNKGYFYFSSDLQSFLYNGIPEDARIKLQTNYISSLINLGKHRWRTFLSLNYITGIDNSYPNYVFINEYNQGLRAFRSSELMGTKKLVVSSENILFSSKEVLGFKVAFFSFFDMAWIAENSQLLKAKTYFSLGGGFRIRNDHLVFKTIQIQLAYFPKIPPGGSEYDFRLTSETVNSFNQFSPRKPYIDIYK